MGPVFSALLALSSVAHWEPFGGPDSGPSRCSPAIIVFCCKNIIIIIIIILSFELNVETDNDRVTGVRREGVPASWSNVRRRRKTIVKIGRLLNLKRFICKKTQFVIDALFDWKPM